jgi:hypothetical protein
VTILAHSADIPQSLCRILEDGQIMKIFPQARFFPCLAVALSIGAPAHAANSAPVNLGAATGFAILSSTGVTDVKASKVTGWVGVSPITGAADHLSCAEVTGRIYSVNAAGPAPCSIMAPVGLTKAIGSMRTAFTNAAGRAPNFKELGGGNIGTRTFGPGVYRWSTGVVIPKRLTLNGPPNGVWIFQIAKNLNLYPATAIVLTGGAQAKNIFWQVSGQALLGTTSHFEGTILSKTLIAMNTGASINGKLLAQTAVTLQKSVVTYK